MFARLFLTSAVGALIASAWWASAMWGNPGMQAAAFTVSACWGFFLLVVGFLDME